MWTAEETHWAARKEPEMLLLQLHGFGPWQGSGIAQAGWGGSLPALAGLGDLQSCFQPQGLRHLTILSHSCSLQTPCSLLPTQE